MNTSNSPQMDPLLRAQIEEIRERKRQARDDERWRELRETAIQMVPSEPRSICRTDLSPAVFSLLGAVCTRYGQLHCWTPHSHFSAGILGSLDTDFLQSIIVRQGEDETENENNMLSSSACMHKWRRCYLEENRMCLLNRYSVNCWTSNCHQQLVDSPLWLNS